MKIVIAVISALLSMLAVATDLIHPKVASQLCRRGFCRFDQMIKSIEAEGHSPSNFGIFVTEDPGDPWLWCNYADALAERGEVDGASLAFDHAISLGPHMPPIMMRAVNFEFGHNRFEQALPLVKHILSETGAFDEIIFSYFQTSRVPNQATIGKSNTQSKPRRHILARMGSLQRN